MKNLSMFIDIPRLSIDYVETLRRNRDFDFLPTIKGYTKVGKQINMGYNCYAMKLYVISNDWKGLSENYKNQWVDSLLDFQVHNNITYKNYFLDPKVIQYFNNPLTAFSLKNNIKGILNTLPKNNYELKDQYIFKTINADNKQVISTLREVGVDISKFPKLLFNSFNNVEEYLNSYNWNKPWDAGAQFSSLAVYDETLNLEIDEKLYNFISNKLDKETGSYFDGQPQDSREIINGAMKVISGLDWLNKEIHLPDKLIDFCLNNKPKFEGCDLVDYVYVLFKCSSQSKYRKKEVNDVLLEVLDYIKLLYHKEEKGFSYFINKSQDYYYGINISKGQNYADIHGTTLSVWAIVMILEALGQNKYEYNLIKP
jgi:hypothetical protein